jgi:hypothetical protein
MLHEAAMFAIFKKGKTPYKMYTCIYNILASQILFTSECFLHCYHKLKTKSTFPGNRLIIFIPDKNNNDFVFRNIILTFRFGLLLQNLPPQKLSQWHCFYKYKAKCANDLQWECLY